MNDMFMFNNELMEGLLVKRMSQFTMEVLLDGEIIKCHCPTTGRIGDIELKNIPCSVSKSDNSNLNLPILLKQSVPVTLTKRIKVGLESIKYYRID